MAAKQELNLVDFLPAYQGIHTTVNDPIYSFYKDLNFYQQIYLKKEFFDLKVPAVETSRIPGAKFQPLNHQSFVARFLSPMTEYNRLLVFHEVGSGKCMGKNSKILMYDGTIKLVQDVKIGDLLMGDNSTPRIVKSLGKGRDQMFRIKQKNGGDDYIVNKNHILSLKISGQKSIAKIKNRGIDYIIGRYFDVKENKCIAKLFNIKKTNEQECRINAQIWLNHQLKVDTVDIELNDYINLKKSHKTFYKGYRVGVEFQEQDLPLDPYFLGLWLGDRTSNRSEITSIDKPIVDYLINKFQDYDITLKGAITYHISPKENKGRVGSNGILNTLKELDLMQNKHIPQIFKVNSRANRLSVLAGLIDTDGYLSKSYYEIVQKNRRLAEDILFMSRSLGFRAQIKEVTKMYTDSRKGHKSGVYNIVTISGANLHEIPVLLQRKKCPITKPNKSQLCGEIQIEPLGEDDYYGFTLDGNNRYLLGDFTVTHNTCLASLLSETAQEINPNLLPTLVLVRNEVLARSWINEVSTTCTNNKYKPADRDPKTGEKITEEQYIRRLNKNISQSYEISTFEKISKELAANDLDYIKEVYSNRIIVIDESHNIRVQPRTTEVSIYNQIFCLLHIVVNTKAILLTATPMRDRPNEVASLMNLILPDTPQYQFRIETFMETYFERDGKTFKKDKRDEFKSRIRGLTSYIRSTSADVRKIYIGSIVTSYLGSQDKGMEKMPLAVAKMSPIQSKSYEEAYRKDRINAPDPEQVSEEEVVEQEAEEEDSGDSSSGLYKYSRQASMFVAPDGTYGAEIEKKWVILSKEEMDARETTKKSSKLTTKEKEEMKADKKGAKGPKIVRPLGDRLTRVSDKLRDYIYNGKANPTDEEKLTRLANLSAKYAGVIREFLTNPTEKAFVYSNLVAGSGTNLFAAVIELFGYVHVSLPGTGEGRINIDPNLSPEDKQTAQLKALQKYKGKKHFILITGKFPTAKQANFLVNQIYNNQENKYGDYIQVIVASKIVGEGISFKHTRQFHNLTPGWNETETQQAAGRVIRAFAHDIFEDPREKFIKIFRWCSMPGRDFPSIDFEMYKLSEDKDYPIKQIERLLKESAVDCALNVKRNMRPDLDAQGSRECDYGNCIYACDDVPAAWYGDNPTGVPPLIEDSYNLYYARGQIDKIKEILQTLFKARFMYDFYELVRLLPEATELILIRALKEIIDQSTPIINKYGITSYLRENSNFYFLVDNHEFKHTSNLFLLAIYNAMPVLKEEMSFKDYVSYFEYIYLDEKLQKLSNLNDDLDDLLSTPAGKDNLARSFRSLSLLIQEELLESFIKAKEQDIELNASLRAAFLDIYRANIVSLDDGTVISSLLLEDYNRLRCYKNEEWSDCLDKEKDQYVKVAEQKKVKLEDNPYGYYGLIDTKKDKFKIVTVFKGVRVAAATGKIDKRIKKDKGKGTECGTGHAFSPIKLKAMMLKFGEIAEKLGEDPPEVSNFLNASNRERIERDVTPAKVKAILDQVHASITTEEEGFVPMKTLKEISAFPEDKLIRWYSILSSFSTGKILCSALTEWFRSHDRLVMG